MSAPALATLLILLGGTSGVSLPEIGGQTSGAAALGAEGMAANPAVAGAIEHRGDVVVDFGLLYSGPTFTRAGEYATVNYTALAPHPYVGVAARPLGGKLGFGLSAGVPFARKPAWPSDGPQRYHAVASEIRMIYVTPAVAFAPTHRLSFGAGLTYVNGSGFLKQSTDLGSMLYAMDTSAPQPPAEDPFLEGRLDAQELSGHSAGYSLGAVVRPTEAFWFGVGFQSPIDISIRGRSVLTPSVDLDLESHADFSLTLPLPPIASAGARWQMNRTWTFGAELEWIGYSRFERAYIEFENSELRGDNAELDAILLAVGATGINLDALFDKSKTSIRGAQDTISGKLIASAKLRDRWTLHSTLGFDRHAIPDSVANPGNVDFDSLIVGLGMERRINGHWTFYATATQYLMAPRSITTSELDPYADPASGKGLPSGNGEYSAFFHRSAIGLKYHWGRD